MPKLFQTIVIFDYYVVAENKGDAERALLAWVKDQESAPSEVTALEARDERNVRRSWRDQRPLIGPEVSDNDFNKIKGKTTIEIFRQIYTKQPSNQERAAK